MFRFLGSICCVSYPYYRRGQAVQRSSHPICLHVQRVCIAMYVQVYVLDAALCARFAGSQALASPQRTLAGCRPPGTTTPALPGRGHRGGSPRPHPQDRDVMRHNHRVRVQRSRFRRRPELGVAGSAVVAAPCRCASCSVVNRASAVPVGDAAAGRRDNEGHIRGNQGRALLFLLSFALCPTLSRLCVPREQYAGIDDHEQQAGRGQRARISRRTGFESHPHTEQKRPKGGHDSEINDPARPPRHARMVTPMHLPVYGSQAFNYEMSNMTYIWFSERGQPPPAPAGEQQSADTKPEPMSTPRGTSGQLAGSACSARAPVKPCMAR